MLFGKEGVGGIEALSQGGDRFQYGALDALMSPLRKPSVWGKPSPLLLPLLLLLIDVAAELWSPQELALFEAGLCSVGKNFYEIAKLVLYIDSFVHPSHAEVLYVCIDTRQIDW